MNRASVLNDLAEYAGTCDDEAATLIPIRPRHFAQRDQVIAVHAERVCGILVVALILVLARGLFLCDVAVGLLRVVVSCIRRDQQWAHRAVPCPARAGRQKRSRPSRTR